MSDLPQERREKLESELTLTDHTQGSSLLCYNGDAVKQMWHASREAQELNLSQRVMQRWRWGLNQPDVALGSNQEDLVGEGRWERKGRVEDDKSHSVVSTY